MFVKFCTFFIFPVTVSEPPWRRQRLSRVFALLPHRGGDVIWIKDACGRSNVPWTGLFGPNSADPGLLKKMGRINGLTELYQIFSFRRILDWIHTPVTIGTNMKPTSDPGAKFGRLFRIYIFSQVFCLHWRLVVTTGADRVLFFLSMNCKCRWLRFIDPVQFSPHWNSKQKYRNIFCCLQLLKVLVRGQHWLTWDQLSSAQMHKHFGENVAAATTWAHHKQIILRIFWLVYGKSFHF